MENPKLKKKSDSKCTLQLNGVQLSDFSESFERMSDSDKHSVFSQTVKCMNEDITSWDSNLSPSEMMERINWILISLAITISLILIAVFIRFLNTLPGDMPVMNEKFEIAKDKDNMVGFPEPHLLVVTSEGSILTISLHDQNFRLRLKHLPSPSNKAPDTIFPYYDAKEESLVFVRTGDKPMTIYFLNRGRTISRKSTRDYKTKLYFYLGNHRTIKRSKLKKSKHGIDALAERLGQFIWILGGMGASFQTFFLGQSHFNETSIWSIRNQRWFKGPQMPGYATSSCIASINSFQAFLVTDMYGAKTFDSHQNSWRAHHYHQGLGQYSIISCIVHITKNFKRLSLTLTTMATNPTATELWVYDLDREDLQKHSLPCENLDFNSFLKSFQGIPYLVNIIGKDFDYSFQFLRLDLSTTPIACSKEHEENVIFSKRPFKNPNSQNPIFKKVEMIEFLVRSHQKLPEGSTDPSEAT